MMRDPVMVDLALQGGGSRRAFTWGVLDRLLNEPWLELDGISGTSASAMNAAVLVDDHAKSAGAGTALENFCRGVSERLVSALSDADRSTRYRGIRPV